MMKPCQNGGKCRSREVTKSPYYSCVCDAKWTGQNCQTKGTYSTLFTRTNVHSYMYSKSLARSVLVVVFLYRCCIAAFPPKKLPPPPENWQYSSPPPSVGGDYHIVDFPPPSSKVGFLPKVFFSDFREKDYGKPIDVKINLLYIPRLLSLHTSVLIMFRQFIIFMDKLLFWFIKNTKNLDVKICSGCVN